MAQPPPCLFFQILRLISYPSMDISESSIQSVICVSLNASISICVYCSSILTSLRFFTKLRIFICATDIPGPLISCLNLVYASISLSPDSG